MKYKIVEKSKNEFQIYYGKRKIGEGFRSLEIAEKQVKIFKDLKRRGDK